MRQLMDDKRIRYLLVAALLVVLVLGLLNVISTAFSLLVPLAIVAVGGFAFYKIVIEGRDANAAMADEVAETAAVELDQAVSEADPDEDEAGDTKARQRLSAIERARGDFVDSATPAQEILDQIQSRKQRLRREDDA